MVDTDGESNGMRRKDKVVLLTGEVEATNLENMEALYLPGPC